MKKCSLLLALTLLLGLFTGCGKTAPATQTAYDKNQESVTVDSGVVAENSSYILRWNDDAKCVALEERQTGRVWSAVPQKYLEADGSSVNVRSPLNIQVMDITSMQWETVLGSMAVLDNGRIFYEPITDGLRITYYFDAYEISVPVEYTLTDEGMTVSIDPTKIGESGAAYQLVSCTVAPFLCSAENGDAGNYLFIPDGSGALMYTYETADEVRKYSGELYGTDPARMVQEITEDKEPVRLPVFGAKDGDYALLGVVDADTGLTFIEAEAGSVVNEYSAVYPTFYFRSYDTVKGRTTANGIGAGNDITRISDELSVQKAQVSYYPLSGESADYNGMAQKVRKLLTDGVASTVAADMYSVTLLGGVKTTSSVLGIPKQTIKAMTTFSQAESIVQELQQLTGHDPAVRLQGYGNGGINAGSVAGGYRFAGVLGNHTQRKALENYCQEQQLALFTDFDLISYGKSGSGFWYSSDVAKTALHKKAEQYKICVPLREFDTDEVFRILKREKLSRAMEKLLSFAEKSEISGLSLSTLGSVAYSDYSDARTFAKSGMRSDVSTLLNAARKAGYPVAVSGGNSYAASSADVLFDIPTDKGQSKALDVAIPFYQMVYGGQKALYSTAINTAANMEQAAALAVMGGTGLGYTLVQNFDISYAETGVGKLYAAVYADHKERIRETTEKYAACYEAIQGASIVRFEWLDGGVGKTVYDNGAVLYANPTAATVETVVGSLTGYECKAIREAG